MLNNTSLDQNNRYKTIRFVTLVGALVNLILAFIKIFVGYIGSSHALLIDGVHSLSDLLSDVLVIYGAKLGAQHADHDHPYGHARIETLFTIFFGFILIAVGMGIIIDSVGRLSQEGVTEIPSNLALIVALISVISKEILYQYTLGYAKKLTSSLLKANAWHHRSDAVSSIVVLIGIAGSIYGIAYLDIVAAIIVAMMIAKIGWDISYEGINELVDRGLDGDELENIKSLIEDIPGVMHLHLLRSRHMGGKALVDVHVQVSHAITVSEGHRISDEVSKRLTKEIDVVSEVLVHIDSEDDEKNSSCKELPLRDEILKQLLKYIDAVNIKTSQQSHSELLVKLKEQLTDSSENLKILYYDGKIKLLLFFPMSDVQMVDDIIELELLFEKDITILNQKFDCTNLPKTEIIKKIKFGFI